MLDWVGYRTLGCLVRAFTSKDVKKILIYLFYILKYYFIFFINLCNNAPNISILIFTYNSEKLYKLHNQIKKKNLSLSLVNPHNHLPPKLSHNHHWKSKLQQLKPTNHHHRNNQNQPPPL